MDWVGRGDLAAAHFVAGNGEGKASPEWLIDPFNHWLGALKLVYLTLLLRRSSGCAPEHFLTATTKLLANVN